MRSNSCANSRDVSLQCRKCESNSYLSGLQASKVERRRKRGIITAKPQKYSGQVSWTGEIRGEDRSPFLPGFTPSGTENSRLTGGRDASRVGRRYFGGLRRGERETINDKPR